MHVIINCFLMFLLLLASIQDIKDRMVSDVYTVTFTVLACLTYCRDIIDFLLIVALLLTAFIMPCRKIGAADIIIYAGMLGIFSLHNFLYIVLTVNVITLILWLIERILKTSYLSNEYGIAMMPCFFVTFPILIYFVGV